VAAGDPAGVLAAAARGKAVILVIERSVFSSENGPVDVEQIRRMRAACGASIVVAWSPSSPPDPVATTPAWADESARGLEGLIGFVALYAAGAAGEPVGELAETRRRVEEARDAAHELAQPLTTIVARSRLLLDDVHKAAPIYRPLIVISEEAGRLARAVERIRAALPPRRRP